MMAFSLCNMMISANISLMLKYAMFMMNSNILLLELIVMLNAVSTSSLISQKKEDTFSL